MRRVSHTMKQKFEKNVIMCYIYLNLMIYLIPHHISVSFSVSGLLGWKTDYICPGPRLPPDD